MYQLIETYSAEETFQLGLRLGQSLPPSSVVAFFGNLGAGKTTFIKGLASGITGVPADGFSSPTFNYLNIYEGKKTLYHFDLYRLTSIQQFQEMGFDEYFDEEGVCCVEWAERITEILPEDAIKVYMKHVGNNHRSIQIIPGYEEITI